MNFYPLDNNFEVLKILAERSNIETFLNEMKEYMKNLSPTQRQKQIQILMSKNIFYYVIFLHITKKQWEYLDYNLYNIWAVDYNQYDGDEGWSLNPNATKEDLVRYEEMKNINAAIEDLSSKEKFFEETNKIFKKIEIENFEISMNFLFLKNNATIHPHYHNKGSFAFHVLLEDLNNNEECQITVNDETLNLLHKGDNFLFNTYNKHSFSYKGRGNKLLSFCITPSE